MSPVQIQELNYRITVTLNSDARSEVEGTRWLLTRRAALALIIVVVSVLGTLRYSVYMTQMQAEERKKVEQTNGESGTDGQSRGSGGGPSGAGGSSPGPGIGSVTGEAEESLLASESRGRGYVSLG